MKLILYKITRRSAHSEYVSDLLIDSRIPRASQKYQHHALYTEKEEEKTKLCIE